MSEVRILSGPLVTPQVSGWSGVLDQPSDGRRSALSPQKVRTSGIHAVRDGVQLVPEHLGRAAQRLLGDFARWLDGFDTRPAISCTSAEPGRPILCSTAATLRSVM